MQPFVQRPEQYVVFWRTTRMMMAFMCLKCSDHIWAAQLSSPSFVPLSKLPKPTKRNPNRTSRKEERRRMEERKRRAREIE